ncbi:MAG: DUF115 domain-containing protein, partial [Candidatus Hydrogenedentota bacterium]
PIWIENTLRNLKFFPQARPVSSLFTQARGLSAAIISTGPSLRESLPWLKENQNRVILFAADSAFQVLMSVGITPHFVFTLDSQVHTLNHFLGLPSSDTYVIADLVANPLAVRAALQQNRQIFFSFTAKYDDVTRQVTPGCDFVENHLLRTLYGSKAIGFIPGDIQSGGSVATSIFDLVRQMEFSNVAFFGQDLAYTNFEIHTPGTHHTKIWLSAKINRFFPLENINYQIIQKRHTLFMKSKKNKPIYSDYILSLYRHWFEEAIPLFSGKVYDLTADGLPITSAMRASYKDFPLHKTSDQQQFLEKVKKITPMQESNEMIQHFFQTLTREKFSSATMEKFPFMENIGRKLAIKMERNPHHPDREKWQQELNVIREKYWNALIRKL